MYCCQQERNHVSAPCFLKDICHPLLRTGQQLQVLMKLLKSCNLSAAGGDAYASCNIIRLEEILPWFDTSIKSSVNSFTFSKSRVEAVICQRDAMYKSMLEKLHHFFSNVEVKLHWLNYTLFLVPAFTTYLGFALTKAKIFASPNEHSILHHLVSVCKLQVRFESYRVTEGYISGNSF